ncbi:hydantoinase/oxoprolinase [Cristinia sonorae]|uniref:Hydantoinase/oxoprolinase n=1 Tax=Cristinia sonorae TaxID=1940300 RepID=A0A8K0UKK8_9AGAR|nr:hydantoinase/oxoprolinase [Cristinia sonorae]
MYRIGVDVGGTNTDGVLIDVTQRLEPKRGIVAQCKTTTTSDVGRSITRVVQNVLEDSGVSPSQVASLSLGTTAFINAVLEADVKRLRKVAVIRLCGPYTRKCPPFIDFPPRLRKIMEGHVAFVDGGLQIDGREVVGLSESQLIEQCSVIKDKGLKNVVICGVFSPLDTNGTQEETARRIVSRELGPSVNIVCSHDVGQLGLLERENASILNASILTFARETIAGFQKAMQDLKITCPIYLTQNDGTLTTAAAAARLPIRTFASGPTNSMRGAAYLAGLDDITAECHGKVVVVVDIGGTTTDVGVLLPSGFPRQSGAFIDIAGVRTNFSMADVQSIALGGGSRVVVTGDQQNRRVTVGPTSVGHMLTQKAMVFGGDVLTATDVVVAAGMAEVGTLDLVSQVPRDIVEMARAKITRAIGKCIDGMKTSPDDIHVLLVGGGGIICADTLPGVAKITCPPFYSVANAVGAAMAKVTGEVDTIEILQGRNIHDVIEGFKLKAIENAILAGADKDTIEIVEVTNLPVQYVTNQATRIIVKAAGDLSDDITPEALPIPDDITSRAPDVTAEDQSLDAELAVPEESMREVDFELYRPEIRPDRSWNISELDLEWIAEGCGILGCGGGGSPYPPSLVARQMLREGKLILVVDAENIPEDAMIVRCTFMGSPSVSNERLQGGVEIPSAIQALMKHLGMLDFTGTISDEIGGGNGIQPMIVAAEMGKVTLDADLMGRAYPNMYQTLPGVFNIPNGLAPCAISDGIGNVVIMSSASNRSSVEHILRAATTEMGSCSGVSMAPQTRKTCQEYGVTRTVSQAWRLGRAVATCRQKSNLKSIPASILQVQNGRCLFVGKIIDVEREVTKGFTCGSVTISPLRKDEEEDGVAAEHETISTDPEDRLVIPFQNENLGAYLETGGKRELIVTVPDLITVLDSHTGSALMTPEYKYGLRVTVIAMAGDPKWSQTPEGLACGGPAAFGLDVAFRGIAEYKTPRSVIEEYFSYGSS